VVRHENLTILDHIDNGRIALPEYEQDHDWKA
jgi:hypothetical protein